MPLLGFQARFAPLVESGQKRQTIRAYRKDGRDPKRGDRLYLWTGLRQKWARKLGETTVKEVSEIRIGKEDGCGIWISVGWNLLDDDAIEEMAISDGFDHAGEMQDWFEKAHGLPFRGLLIEWGEIEK